MTCPYRNENENTFRPIRSKNISALWYDFKKKSANIDSHIHHELYLTLENDPQHAKRFYVLMKIFESADTGDEAQITSFKTNFLIWMACIWQTLTPMAKQQTVK